MGFHLSKGFSVESLLSTILIAMSAKACCGRLYTKAKGVVLEICMNRQPHPTVNPLRVRFVEKFETNPGGRIRSACSDTYVRLLSRNTPHTNSVVHRMNPAFVEAPLSSSLFGGKLWVHHPPHLAFETPVGFRYRVAE